MRVPTATSRGTAAMYAAALRRKLFCSALLGRARAPENRDHFRDAIFWPRPGAYGHAGVSGWLRMLRWTTRSS
jgi:hypothetical protein